MTTNRFLPGALLALGTIACAALILFVLPSTAEAAQVSAEQLRNTAGWTCTGTPATSCKHTDGRTAPCQQYRTGSGNETRCEVPPAGGAAASGPAAAAPPTAAPAAASEKQPAQAPVCSITGGTFHIGECIAKGLGNFAGWIAGGFALILLTLASFILWIVGGLFNWVVIKTVFEFGSTFGTSEGMILAWGILRDIANIALLFAFIFMGLATILNTHALDEYSARKALPSLIIFAVLMNFSLFATQIVIDVSNSFAAVFTAQASLSGCTGAEDTRDVREALDAKTACANNGIAGQVIQMAGISSVFSMRDLSNLNFGNAAPVYIGLTIFITITAVVLLAAAIMLVIRAVVLCLLMVLSPIGFAGMAIPPLQEFARRWWKQLLSNAFFAPIYLLLVLISLKIVEGLIGPNDKGSFATAMIEGSTNAPQIFVIFAVVIGFMVMSLMVAKGMGAAGADFATKSAGRVVFGAQGFVARRTLGRASNLAAERIRQSSFGKTETGRFFAGIADRGAKASYSGRGIATTLGKGAHLDFGKPDKVAGHGYHGIEEKAVEDRVKYAKSLVGRDRTKEEIEEEEAAEQAVATKKSAVAPLKTKKDDAEKAVEDAEKNAQAARAAAEEHVARTGLPDARLESEAARAEAELKVSQASLATASAELATANDELAAAEKAEKATKDRIKYDISKKAAQKEYGKVLEERGHNGWLKGHTVAVSQRADHHASGKIVSEADKSDVLKAIENAAKEEAEKSKGGAAPAAAPAAGGGDAH